MVALFEEDPDRVLGCEGVAGQGPGLARVVVPGLGVQDLVALPDVADLLLDPEGEVVGGLS